MATAKKEVSTEETIQALRKEIEGLQSAVRRLSNENNQTMSIMAQTREDLGKARADIERVQLAQKKAGVKADAGITRYE